MYEENTFSFTEVEGDMGWWVKNGRKGGRVEARRKKGKDINKVTIWDNSWDDSNDKYMPLNFPELMVIVIRLSNLTINSQALVLFKSTSDNGCIFFLKVSSFAVLNHILLVR